MGTRGMQQQTWVVHLHQHCTPYSGGGQKGGKGGHEGHAAADLGPPPAFTLYASFGGKEAGGGPFEKTGYEYMGAWLLRK